MAPSTHWIMLVLGLASAWWTAAPSAQSASTHVTIPFLANATKPDALEFEGAECDADGDHLTCTFQQLFLTTSPAAPDTCLVTTNSYERVFSRDAGGAWTSSGGPSGACGVVERVTVRNDGGVKWTMDLAKVVTNRIGSAACLAMPDQTETFSWQNIRRPLPCKNVQPGALIR
jgi:hypothetical protein